MTPSVYKELARHLDTLPGGFPETESGVELRILKLLFTETEARMALHLRLISETARTLSIRSGMPESETRDLLKTMADKGLIFCRRKKGDDPTYLAAQYIVGIWELQVGRLTPELAECMGEYLPHLFNVHEWKKAPQMRVIPVDKSIDPELTIMTYEHALSLIEKKDRFILTPCICRKEMAMTTGACDRPLDVCISFGDTGDYFVRQGIGREVSRDKIREVLKTADRAGLVLQPSQGKDIHWICCCCGCCCAVLRILNRYPAPAELVATPFAASLDANACKACGICENRCPMGAITPTAEKQPILDPNRCIGCGLCVSTCPTHALTLARKPPAQQPQMPANIYTALARLAWKRGKLTPLTAAAMAGASMLDRARSMVKG